MSDSATYKPLIGRSRENSGIHVLIVSVGRYTSSADLALPGARASAERLAHWWIRAESEQRFLDGHRLGSLDVLVSADEPLCLAGDDGVSRPMKPAEAATVREALLEWCKRNAPGSTAVFHWIGHGEIQGDGGRAPVHALYCEDLVELAGRRYRNGVDWNAVLEGIAAHAPASRLVCSIDACRVDAPQGDSFTYQSPFGTVPRQSARRQQRAVYYSTLGRSSYCLDPGVDACGDFSGGGAIMSEAMLLALDRFGAIDQSDRFGPAAYIEAVTSGTQARLDRWRDRIPQLAELDSSVILEPNNWPWKEPIMRVPTPLSMVDVSLDDDVPTGDARCTVLRPPAFPAPHKGPINWQFDGSRCEHEVEVDGGACLAGKRSRIVLCAHPHHDLVMRQDQDP